MARISEASLKRFSAAALEAVGTPPDSAAIVAETLVEADKRGLNSHGVLRLTVYLSAVRAGGIVPDAEMRWLSDDKAVAVLDAAFGFGQVAMFEATDFAIRRANELGAAVVGIRNSTHFGAGSFWASRLTAQGLACIITSNTGPVVAPFGSRAPILGTNPMTIGVPTLADPFLLDMATSEAAYGKIVAAAAEGASIPSTWAVDADGRSTEDPAAALAGALLPFGGHKGSGLAIAVELLSSAVVGSRSSHEITDIWIDPSSQMGTGHLIIAFRTPVPEQAMREKSQELLDFMRGSDPAQGHAQVMTPGDVENQRVRTAEGSGIDLPDGIRTQLQALADELTIELDFDL